jgi:hypothetical protein
MPRKLSSILLFFLCLFAVTSQGFSYEICAKLKELKIPYEKLEDKNPFVRAYMGEIGILISKDGIRNQENKVVRAVVCVFEPLILTEEHVDELLKANEGKTPDKGIWGVWGAEEQQQVIYYEIDIPEDASDKVLTDAIIKCSKAETPFLVDEEQQLALAIYQVMELDKVAGNAGSSEETVKMMRQINLDLCPIDFALAYRKHLKAWEKSLDKSGGDVGASAGAEVGFPVIGALIGKSVQALAQSGDIYFTFDEVKKIARRYGITGY